MGNLVSGFLVGPLGLRNVFRVLALVCGVTCILYFITNCLFFRKLQKKRKLRAKRVGNPCLNDSSAEEQREGTNMSHRQGSITQEDDEADIIL